MSFSFRRLAVALVVVVAAVGATGVSLAATAAPTQRAATQPKAVAEKLVNRMYSDIKASNFPALKVIIDGAVFRSQAANRAPLGRAAFIRDLANSRLLSFGVRDVHAAAARGVMVATYQAKTTWVIGGKTVIVPWSARMLTAREVASNGPRAGSGPVPLVEITSLSIWGGRRA